MRLCASGPSPSTRRLSRYTGNIRETLEQHSRTHGEVAVAPGRRDPACGHRARRPDPARRRRIGARVRRKLGERWAPTANMLKEVSNGLLNQIHGLTKRFEDQGANIMNAARALEVQNTKVDSIMETRQAQLTKMIEGINGRASELDRMMHNYSNMLEQSLAQAEVRAKQVTEVIVARHSPKSRRRR